MNFSHLDISLLDQLSKFFKILLVHFAVIVLNSFMVSDLSDVTLCIWRKSIEHSDIQNCKKIKMQGSRTVVTKQVREPPPD